MGSFIETLINRKFDLNDEIEAIDALMNERSAYTSSLLEAIENSFRMWRHRANFISLKSMFSKLGLDEILLKAKQHCINLEQYIYYVECIVNVIMIPHEKSLFQLQISNRKTITENINRTLQQLNFQIHYFESEDYFRIIVKDWKVSESAEVVGEQYGLGEKIYLYNHNSLKGELYEKADILCRLYKVFETKENILKANQYTTLASDIGFLSDKLDVRHAPNPKEKMLLDGFNKNEQEQWYDELFDLFLDMLILCEHIEKRKDIGELKKKYGDIKI